MTSTPEIDAIRARIARVREAARHVLALPLAEREVAGRIDAEIEALARRVGEISVASLDAAFRQSPAAVLAKLFPDALRHALLPHPAPNGEKPVTSKQKAARRAELEAEIDQLERDEELAIRVAEERGEEIDRRIDARAELLLEEDL